MLLQVPQEIQALNKYITSLGGQLYLVGGCVRDVLQGIVPHDLDLATSFWPSALQKLLNVDIDGWQFHTLPTGEKYGTITVVCTKPCAKKSYEITTFRRDLSPGRHPVVSFSSSLIEDLARRDFTINAMALPIDTPAKENLIDPFNGFKDLQHRVLRAVGDPTKRFSEDPLRILRACRFSGYGTYGFTIEPQTFSAMQTEAHRLMTISRERIAEEVKKILLLPRPSRCFRTMQGAGNILSLVCKPLADCIGVEQNKHHNETVFEHCLAACDAIPPCWPNLRLAALLHDVGKPSTLRGEGDAATFYEHELVGATLAYNYLNELKGFDKRTVEYVVRMVRWHMYHFNEETKLSTIKKWLRDLGYQECMDLIKLRMADRKANRAKAGLHLMTYHMRKLAKTLHQIIVAKDPLGIKDLAIKGEDLIKLGYLPGPIFSYILNKLVDMVIVDSLLNNRELLLAQVPLIAKKYVEQKSHD